MIRALTGFIILLTLSSFLSADAGYTVQSSLFIPQSYYVGDRVELRIVLRTSGDVQVAPPREFPGVAWGEIHGARVSPREGAFEIRIHFTAYQPGTQTLPLLRFGDIVLEGQNVYVRSLVDEGRRDFSPPRGQLLLPSTKLVLGLTVGGFIALPLLGTFLFFWVRPRLGRLIARYLERRPYKRLQKELKILHEQNSELDGRRFYILLLEELKIYLSRRGGKGDCMAYTTREMEEYLIDFFADSSEVEPLLRIFQFGDRVKFGGGRTSREKRMEDLDLVAEISRKIEKRDSRNADL